MTRDALRSFLITRILAFDLPHPVRVAIDGVAGSGKTTLANDLAPLCANAGRDVVRASIDGFHRPRAERYRRGSESPDGFYEDSFDYRLCGSRSSIRSGPAATAAIVRHCLMRPPIRR